MLGLLHRGLFLVVLSFASLHVLFLAAITRSENAPDRSAACSGFSADRIPGAFAAPLARNSPSPELVEPIIAYHANRVQDPVNRCIVQLMIRRGSIVGGTVDDDDSDDEDGTEQTP